MNFRTRPYTSGIMIGTGRPQTKDAPAFGERLAAARTTKDWPQTELADRLDTTLKMIDYYERRTHDPSVEFVRQAARGLGVLVAELLGEEVQLKRVRKTGPAAWCIRFLKRSPRSRTVSRKRSLRLSPLSSANTGRSDSEKPSSLAGLSVIA